MQRLSEKAPAKVNLSLRVLGQRTDGFHQISSIVAFADIADVLELTPSTRASFAVSGPFAAAITADDNLVERAERAFREKCSSAQPARISLDKQLPVAAGIGGGSADAAAALRLMANANPGCVPAAEIEKIAASLGSDVVVCLASRAARMSGRGEKVTPLAAFPPLHVVLVNPGAALAAGEIYAALRAAPSNGENAKSAETIPRLETAHDVIAHMRETGNDLEAPAIAMAPVVGEVLSMIAETPGCAIARMSGSGSTCFGIYETAMQAETSAQIIAESYPDWWIKKAILN